MLLARPARGTPLVQGELIGLQVRVAASGDAGLVGLAGVVVDETQRTLRIEAAGPRGPREVVVPKRGQTFTFTRPDGAAETVAGEDLAHRPEERTKKARPRGAPAGRRTRSPR